MAKKPSYADQLYNQGIYKFNVPPDFKSKFSTYIEPDPYQTFPGSLLGFDFPNLDLPGAYYPDQDARKQKKSLFNKGAAIADLVTSGIGGLFKGGGSASGDIDPRVIRSIEKYLATKEQAAQDWRNKHPGESNWNLFGVSSPTADVKLGKQASEKVWDEGALSEGQEGIGPLLHDASVRERKKDDYNIMQSLEDGSRFEPSEPPESKPGFFDKGGGLAGIMGHEDFGDSMIDFGLGLAKSRGGLMSSLTQAAAATQKGYKERKVATAAAAMKKAELAVKTHEAMSKRMKAIPGLTYNEALKHVVKLMSGDMGLGEGMSEEQIKQAREWARQLMDPSTITPKIAKGVTAVPTMKIS